jgi:hypothetical protein
MKINNNSQLTTNIANIYIIYVYANSLTRQVTIHIFMGIRVAGLAVLLLPPLPASTSLESRVDMVVLVVDIVVSLITYY